MIRACIRRVTLTSNSCTSSAFRCNSTETIRTKAKEIRDVKLIGTIHQNPLTLDSGTKLLTVKTMQPDNHYKLHRAFISNPRILNIFGDNLSAGQRVYISGELRCKAFVNNENHKRQRISIQVNELYATKSAGIQAHTEDDDASANIDDTKTKCIDCNNVSMLSHIASDIQHLENFSRFYLASNFTVKNPVDGENQKLTFYHIFVHDPNLINYVKENLQRKDRVFLFGSLNYKPEIDQNGEKTYGGYIEATNIFKIDRFSELSNENPIQANYKSASE